MLQSNKEVSMALGLVTGSRSLRVNKDSSRRVGASGAEVGNLSEQGAPTWIEDSEGFDG